MAHNITDRDGFFTVREPAWHGLGVVLPDYPTREEAQQLAHPWEPVSEPIYRKIPRIHTHGPECREPVCDIPELYEDEVRLDDYVLNVRSDDGGVLGVTSEGYELVKNAEMYDIAEAIEGEASGSVMYETGGSLKGGRKVWLLLRLKDPIVLNNDPMTATVPYFALQNSHDGSSSFRGQATMTRIVCDNTAQMADLDAQARGTEFSFRHTRNIGERIDEAREALAGWRESIETYRLMTEHLLTIPVGVQDRNTFVERFIPTPMVGTVTERVMNNVEIAQRTFFEILNGETCEGINDTAYGLVQAAVEYLNHGRRAHTQASRFKRSYLDRDTLVKTAMELALDVA